MVESSSCSEKVGLKKGPWTPEEDHKLMTHIQQHGHGSWRALPAKAGLQRCGKSCRLRWTNYLRPDIKRGKFSLQEEQTIIQLHALLGNRWSAIAAHLPKRTDNEIKNYWNTHLKKRLIRLGIDPTTHKPKNDAVNGQSKDSANLSHMAQWESARLEAEARLVKESKLQVQNQLGSSSSTSHQPALTRLVLNKITPQPSLPPCLDVLKAWQNSWSTSKASTPTKHNTKMHSMYAMMLATDDLESPTSTLSFPETTLPNSKSNNSIASGLIKQNLVPSSTTSAAAHDGGIMKKGSDSEPWGHTTPSLRDDDIMVAVEAFRSRGGGCNENYAETDMEGLDNDDVLLYVPNENPIQENLGILNEDEGSTNFEEKHYWNTIFNLVNDLTSPASPVF